MLTTTITMRNRRNLLHDSQTVHRTLMHACMGVRPLWGTPDMLHLVVRHESPVDWVREFPDAQQCVTLPTEVPITGVPVRYAMIGNPITNVTQPGGRGKRVPAPPEKWKSWCERRLGDALNLTLIDSTLLPTATGKKNTMKTTHQRVLFTGEATVKNQEALAQVMRDGTGPGKAYGCGLLLVEVMS